MTGGTTTLSSPTGEMLHMCCKTNGEITGKPGYNTINYASPRGINRILQLFESILYLFDIYFSCDTVLCSVNMIWLVIFTWRSFTSQSSTPLPIMELFFCPKPHDMHHWSGACTVEKKRGVTASSPQSTWRCQGTGLVLCQSSGEDNTGSLG